MADPAWFTLGKPIEVKLNCHDKDDISWRRITHCHEKSRPKKVFVFAWPNHFHFLYFFVMANQTIKLTNYIYLPNMIYYQKWFFASTYLCSLTMQITFFRCNFLYSNIKMSQEEGLRCLDRCRISKGPKQREESHCKWWVFIPYITWKDVEENWQESKRQGWNSRKKFVDRKSFHNLIDLLCHQLLGSHIIIKG